MEQNDKTKVEEDHQRWSPPINKKLWFEETP